MVLCSSRSLMVYTAMCGQATICAALLRRCAAFRVLKDIAIYKYEINLAASQLLSVIHRQSLRQCQ